MNQPIIHDFTTEQYKRCPHCGLVKKVNEFYRDESRQDGLDGWCKVCRRAADGKRRTKKKELKAQKCRPLAMSGAEFYELHTTKGWLFRYIGEMAAAETSDKALREDLRQEAWIRLSFCRRDLSDEALKKVVRRAVHQAYMKEWRDRNFELETIERMTRDEYTMWMVGAYPL